MATREDIFKLIQEADKAGNSAAVRDLSALYDQAAPAKVAAGSSKPDPTDGMGTGERLLAGAGKGFADLKRGVVQAVLDSPMGRNTQAYKDNQAYIDESTKLDAPLMNTTAGKTGYIGQQVATAIPAMMVPGANGVVGSTVAGGLLGAAQPIATGQDQTRAGNVGLGMGLGFAGPVAARGIGTMWNSARAMVEPLTATGQSRIAGRTLEEFAQAPNALRGLPGGRTATGAELTLAEASGDGGIARLQDSLRAANPQFGNQLDARVSANNASRVATLEQLAGVDGRRATAVASRSANGAQNYGNAFQAPFSASSLSPAQAAEMQTLMQAPAVKQAMEEARKNATNSGKQFSTDGSVEGLHQMKLAMDDQISTLTGGTAAEANKAAGIKSAQRRLVKLIEEVSPDYRMARQTFAAESKPINEMDIMREVLKRGTGNTSDMATGAPRLMPNALLGSLRDEPALIRRATGRELGNGLANVVEPANLNLLRSVASEADRSAGVAAAGNGPGSATISRLGTQNALNAFVKSSGLPAGMADNTMAQTFMKPLNLLYGGVAQPKIEAEIGKALLDPAYANQLVQMANQGQIQLPNNVIFQLSGVAAKGALPAANNAAHR